MAKKTYYDYANNQASYLIEDIDNGRVADYIAAGANEVCEKYLKFIVDTSILSSNEDRYQREKILHSHNIKAILAYIRNQKLYNISTTDCRVIYAVDGYYFSNRYPNDDAVEVSSEILAECREAIVLCKSLADDFISSSTGDVQQQLEQQQLEIERFCNEE